MKQKLIAEGYKIVKVKNTWLVDGPYKGVNTVVEKMVSTLKCSIILRKVST